MDSNFSRLYYMLNDGSDHISSVGTSSGTGPLDRTNSESRNLLNNVSNNDLSLLQTNESFNTAATLEVSSTTIINRLNVCPDGKETGKRRNSSEVQMEYHFNPLYIISDQNTSPNNQQQNAQQPNNTMDPSSTTTTCYTTNSIYDHINGQLISAPSDQYGLIYLALLLAGIGFLLPYNSFMIAVDYFQQRFPNTTIVFDMSTTYIIFAFITVIIQNFFVETIPLYWRLNFGYCLSLLFMVIVVLYEIWARLGTYFDNLVMISIIAIGCTIQQSTFYGYTSMLPKRYVQAVMTGESAAGIFVSMNRIVTKTLYPQDPEYNTALFFSISIILILICAIVHTIFLPRSDFIRYHMFICNQKPNADGAQIIHQINENVGLVNMYHNKENNNNNSSDNGTSRLNHRNNVFTQNDNSQINQNYDYSTSMKSYYQRPSIFSTESINAENDPIISSAIHRHTGGNLNTKVQNMLRTDSNEFVLPFGIDDEEIVVVENSQQQTRPFTDDSLDLSNNQENSDHYSVSFKSSNPTTFLVRWLHYLEINTHFLYNLRKLLRRIRNCDERFTRFMVMVHTKYFIRKNIVHRIWPYIVSIMLVYFVTLTIFPGIESEIYSCRYGDWFPIILMATFNLTDFIGKLMSTLFYRINKLQLLTISCFRFILIPLFALSVAPRAHPFFANPLMPIMFSTILGLTNGIFGSLPMILAPFNVNEQMREITGNLMTFSYVIGLTSGSFASYVLNYWTSTSNSSKTNNHYRLYCSNNDTTFTTTTAATTTTMATMEMNNDVNFLNDLKNITTIIMKTTMPTMVSTTTTTVANITNP